MAGSGGVNMEQFEVYFQKADLDRDGRISGAEAVGFFQGSNLPKQVLAQIWMHADQNRIGYLSRPEFYNALKLVTVAQSKRELTPDIVKAALYGPASAKIPAPQINLSATPVPAPASAPSPAPAPVPPSAQNFSFRGLSPSGANMNLQPRQPLPTMGMNQFGHVPQSSGLNQQFGQAQSSTMSMGHQVGHGQYSVTGNQQFGHAPSNTNLGNQQFGHAPLNTNLGNQQFVHAPSNTNLGQQFLPVQSHQLMKPSSLMPTGATLRPSENASILSTSTGDSMVSSGFSKLNDDREGIKSGAPPIGPLSEVLNRGSSPSVPSVAPNPQNMLSTFSSTSGKAANATIGSGTGSMLDPMFGRDAFSVNQSSSGQIATKPQHFASNLPTSSATVPVASVSQPLTKPDPFESLQGPLTKPSTGGQVLPSASLPKSHQPAQTEVNSSISSSGQPAVDRTLTSQQPQISWPKMTRASIQKYTKVFLDVDTDRDGKITGEQARNLFLSWRLPREVLKQIWDLSDQDNDSSLSLREFCVALYLMERYREGQTLPSTLPNSVILDETLLSLAGPPTAFGNVGWNVPSGLRPQQGLLGAQTIASSGLRPPVQPMISPSDVGMEINEKNSRGPVIANFHANQQTNGENFLDSQDQEAVETNETKVENKDDMLLDSKEKIVFYRTKMQDLVLYKSRCDNRLNEITERARADKGEAELLEKKYQEKYKQVAEIHSKLTIEEASFRETQARKMELHQAIVKMEQGGSADGILQVRADRIQSDLEELLKALADRCMKHSVEMKSPAFIELPPGWQPGILEEAAIWDEDWDKFEDEGFSFHVDVPPSDKTASFQRDISSPSHASSPDSVLNSDATPEKVFSTEVNMFETESVYSADESKSPQVSPRREAYESSSQESSENHYRKRSDGDAETQRSFDDHTWGNFDNNDDIDSVWGFNAKDSDNVKHEDKYLFGSNDFDANRDKTDLHQADSRFQNSSLYTFEDFVPSSPLSRAGNSPSRNSIESRDPFFDSFSRYGSFSRQDSPSSPSQKNLTRFDSVSSARDFDHSRGFSFDESDSFSSAGPFKVSSETPKKESDKWSAF